jgi:magnesium transporter
MPRTRLYRDGVLVAEDFPVTEVSDHLSDKSATVWVDLQAPQPDELVAVGEELGLHRLAVEDVLDQQQRPKLDRYPSHLFVSAYAMRVEPTTGELATAEVSAFVTGNALVTVRIGGRFDTDAVVARWDAAPELARYGVAFLLHGLLDYVVDTQLASVDLLDEQVEALEDQVLTDQPSDVDIQRRTYQLRKSLVTLRRLVLPMQGVVDSLRRREGSTFDEVMIPYYQDVYDHVLRTGERIDSLRELVSTMLETQLIIRGNRLNVIMKQVTSWAAIIAVPTAVTGFYGQNLPYPGSGRFWGFLASTAVIAVTSVGLYLAFRRKGWI